MLSLLNNASPSIINCTFDNDGYGVRLLGNSNPVLDNNTFNNLICNTFHCFYIILSMRALITIKFPGTTLKAIEIQSETLTQDYYST